MQNAEYLMAEMQSRFDHYSRTIANSAVSEFDAESDPVKRFRKYAYTITNSEHAAIEALIDTAKTPENEAEAGHTVEVRLDSDIVDHFRKAGGDCQRRIIDLLRASTKKL